MTRTITKPPDDERAWHEVLAAFHPDRRPDKKNAHETFIWLMSVKEVVCGGQTREHIETPPREEPRHQDAGHDDPDRVSFPACTDFREATLSALRYSDNNHNIFADVLWLLADCAPRSINAARNSAVHLTGVWRQSATSSAWTNALAHGGIESPNLSRFQIATRLTSSVASRVRGGRLEYSQKH